MIAKGRAERVPLGNQILLSLYPKLLLSLSENREISHITHGNLTIYFDRFLCLFDHKTKPVFGNTSILIKRLYDAVIGSRSYLPIDLLLPHQKLNGSFAVCAEVVGSPNPCFNYFPNLIRLFLDLLHSRSETATRVTEEFVGFSENHKTHFCPEVVHWGRGYCRSSQALLHSSKPGCPLACTEEFYILFRIETEMS